MEGWQEMEEPKTSSKEYHGSDAVPPLTEKNPVQKSWQEVHGGIKVSVMSMSNLQCRRRKGVEQREEL